MRTIKFRGLAFNDFDFDFINVHISKNEFIHGNLIVDGEDCYIVNGVISCDEDNLQLERWIPVRPETIGQFTGLHDKNGVEIYEGDIIHITKGLGNFANKKGQVVFTEGAFHIEGQGFTLSFSSQYGIEIIGNIHEREKNE